MRDFIASRIDRMPRLQQQLVPSSLRLKRPTWEDATADLTHHVQQLNVQAPGDDAALETAVAEIMEKSLEFSRPLWDVPLLTGLQVGCFALVCRMHHAVADGQGSVVTLGNLLDPDPQGTTSLADVLAGAAPPPRHAPASSTRSLVMGAAARGGDLSLQALRKSLHPAEAAESVAGPVDDARRRAREQLKASTTGVQAVASPRIGRLLGGDPGQRLYWRTHQVAMDDVKAVRVRSQRLSTTW